PEVADGGPAAVAGDQLVLPVDAAHRRRLQQSGLPDGLGQISDPGIVVPLHLEGTVLEDVEGEVEDFGSRRGDCGKGHARLRVSARRGSARGGSAGADAGVVPTLEFPPRGVWQPAVVYSPWGRLPPRTRGLQTPAASLTTPPTLSLDPMMGRGGGRAGPERKGGNP